MSRLRGSGNRGRVSGYSSFSSCSAHEADTNIGESLIKVISIPDQETQIKIGDGILRLV